MPSYLIVAAIIIAELMLALTVLGLWDIRRKLNWLRDVLIPWCQTIYTKLDGK